MDRERSVPPNANGAEATEFPRSIGIIGYDDPAETYRVLYSDSRGVSRKYDMSFDDGVWKMWRDSTDFAQRFEGILSEDAQTIDARWEKSNDGTEWEHDFDLRYSREQ